MILLDSSVLIELFRVKKKEKTLFYNLSMSNNDLAISTITFYEVGIGNKKSHSVFWDSLCEQFTIIPFDKACSTTAITVYLDLLKINKMIDIADIFIGATALTHEIPIATLNLKDFERIKDLEIINFPNAKT